MKLDKITPAINPATKITAKCALRELVPLFIEKFFSTIRASSILEANIEDYPFTTI